MLLQGNGVHETWDAVQSSVYAFVQPFAQQHPRKPMILMGRPSGGNLAMLVACQLGGDKIVGVGRGGSVTCPKAVTVIPMVDLGQRLLGSGRQIVLMPKNTNELLTQAQDGKFPRSDCKCAPLLTLCEFIHEKKETFKQWADYANTRKPSCCSSATHGAQGLVKLLADSSTAITLTEPGGDCLLSIRQHSTWLPHPGTLLGARVSTSTPTLSLGVEAPAAWQVEVSED